MVVRWPTEVPGSHPASPGRDSPRALSLRGLDGLHATSGVVGSPLEFIWKLRVRKGWLLKGNLRCVIYYTSNK